MNCYYVDYENVQNDGLNGIQNLRKSDQVFILYSKNANKLKPKMVQNIKKSLAKVSFIEIQYLGSNALDFQLCVLMGMKIGEFSGKTLDIYIVSKDHGYDSVKNGVSDLLSETLKKRNISLSISRIQTINEQWDNEKFIKDRKNMITNFITIFNSNIENKQTNLIHICKDVDFIFDCINELLKKYKHFKTSQKRCLVKVLETFPIDDFIATLISYDSKENNIKYLLQYLNYNIYSRSPEHKLAVAQLRNKDLKKQYEIFIQQVIN